MKRIIIATIKSWNIAASLNFQHQYKNDYKTTVITTKEDLIYDKVIKLNPHYIFFPHWSWIIPKNIFNNFECIVFHMTDLPFGRGGSPLQNLILRKKYKTKISAIRVSEGVDEGPIYFKEDFDVTYGSAQDILINLSNIIFTKMMPKFLSNRELIPKEQLGEAISFVRRLPEQSNLMSAKINCLQDYYDFIRMLDGEGYPVAFLSLHKKKIIFKNIKKNGKKLIGTFEIE